MFWLLLELVALFLAQKVDWNFLAKRTYQLKVYPRRISDAQSKRFSTKWKIPTKDLNEEKKKMNNYFIKVRPSFNGIPINLEEMDGEMKAYIGDILKALGINESVEHVLKNIPEEDISKKGDKRKRSYIGPEQISKLVRENKTAPNDFGEWFSNILRQLEEGEILEAEKKEEEHKISGEDSYSTDLLEEILRRQNLILDNQIRQRQELQEKFECIEKDISEIQNWMGFLAESMGKIVEKHYKDRQ